MYATLEWDSTVLTFRGDGEQTKLTLGSNGLVGWFEGVETQGETINRPGADGAFDTPLFRAGRMVTTSGLVLADSDASDFEGTLYGLASVPTQALARFTVYADSGDTYADVRRIGKPDLRVHTWGVSADYQLTLFAPDPNRYGSGGSPVYV